MAKRTGCGIKHLNLTLPSHSFSSIAHGYCVNESTAGNL